MTSNSRDDIFGESFVAYEIRPDGLVGFRSRVWSRAGRILASGGGQLLCRPVPPDG